MSRQRVVASRYVAFVEGCGNSTSLIFKSWPFTIDRQSVKASRVYFGLLMIYEAERSLMVLLNNPLGKEILFSKG